MPMRASYRQRGDTPLDMREDLDPASLELDGLEAVLAEAYMRQGPLVWLDRQSPAEHLKALAELARRKAHDGTLGGPDPQAVAELVWKRGYKLAAMIQTDAAGTPLRLQVWRQTDETILAEWSAPEAPKVQDVMTAAKLEPLGGDA